MFKNKFCQILPVNRWCHLLVADRSYRFFWDKLCFCILGKNRWLIDFMVPAGWKTNLLNKLVVSRSANINPYIGFIFKLNWRKTKMYSSKSWKFWRVLSKEQFFQIMFYSCWQISFVANLKDICTHNWTSLTSYQNSDQSWLANYLFSSISVFNLFSNFNAAFKVDDTLWNFY